MNPIAHLLSRIEAYCTARGITESTFGRYVVNDGKFVARLKAGGSMTLKTLERVEAALEHSSIGSVEADQKPNAPQAEPDPGERPPPRSPGNSP